MKWDSACRKLSAVLHDENHARTQDCHVLVVALERGDRGLVSIGDRVESFAVFDSVAHHGGIRFAILVTSGGCSKLLAGRLNCALDLLWGPAGTRRGHFS